MQQGTKQLFKRCSSYRLDISSGDSLSSEGEDPNADHSLLNFVEQISAESSSLEPSYFYVEPLPHYLHVVIHEGNIPPDTLMGFTDPFIRLQYGCLKDFTLPTTEKKAFQWRSHHIISTLKIFGAGRSKEFQALQTPGRRLAYQDSTDVSRGDEFEGTHVRLSLRAWNPGVGNQTLSNISIPVRTIPGYHGTPPAASELPKMWYLLESRASPRASQPQAERPPEPALCLSTWYEPLLDAHALAPVIGQVDVVIRTIQLTTKHAALATMHSPYAVLKYERHWARLPVVRGTTSVDYRRTFTCDVRDASTMFKIAVFDAQKQKAKQFQGMAQIRISTLPHDRWERLNLPLYVRKEGLTKCNCSIRQKGTIALEVRWRHGPMLPFLRHYLQPTKSKKFYSGMFREKERELTNQHLKLVSAYLEYHDPPLPGCVVSVMLANCLSDFNVNTSKVQMKRFGRAMKQLGAVQHTLSTITSWDYPLVTMLSFVLYCWGVYHPLCALQVALLLLLGGLVYGHLRRGNVEEQWAMDVSLFQESKKPDDPDEGRQHSLDPLFTLRTKLSSAETFACKFQQGIGTTASHAERLLGFLGHDCYDNHVGLLTGSFLLFLLLWVTFLPPQPLLILAALVPFRPPRIRTGTGGPFMHLLSRIPTRQDRVIPPRPS